MEFTTIKLIAINDSNQNDMGDSPEVESLSAEIAAIKTNIRQSEFYQAFSTGLKPSAMFTIHSSSYNGEEFLLYGTSEKYKILRTYIKPDENIELICEKV